MLLRGTDLSRPWRAPPGCCRASPSASTSGSSKSLTTLLAGGTPVFPGEAAGDPAFAREIVRQGIDTLHTIPAFARELAAAGWVLEGLEILHLGGEALTRDTVARLRRRAPRAVLYNGYGPTEATVNSSIFRIPGPDSSGSTIPIGRPSADNALYILDRAASSCRTVSAETSTWAASGRRGVISTGRI